LGFRVRLGFFEIGRRGVGNLAFEQKHREGVGCLCWKFNAEKTVLLLTFIPQIESNFKIHYDVFMNHEKEKKIIREYYVCSYALFLILFNSS